MKHKFLPKVVNREQCALCSRNSLEHGITKCESCSNESDCELSKDNILQCLECRMRDSLSNPQIIPSVIKFDGSVTSENIDSKIELSLIEHSMIAAGNTIDRIAESSTVKNITEAAILGNIKQYTDFFNSKTISIKHLEDEINTDDGIPTEQKQFKLAEFLGRRVKHLTKVLFEVRTTEIEMSAEIKSIQKYMNDIIPKLRAEQRAIFAAQDVQYTPQIIKQVKAPKVKLSTVDKMAANYALAMNISIERARFLLTNKLKEEGDSCTCQETPGICKIHKS